LARMANVDVAHQVQKVPLERLDRMENLAGQVRKATKVRRAQLDQPVKVGRLVEQENKGNRVALAVVVFLARMLPTVLVRNALPPSLGDISKHFASAVNEMRFIGGIFCIISSTKCLHKLSCGT
uniref:Uncharacterized protein n=1 Tax=Parascaris univalens TaxID=6257 RepID=A0A915AVY0_PARUN